MVEQSCFLVCAVRSPIIVAICTIAGSQTGEPETWSCHSLETIWTLWGITSSAPHVHAHGAEWGAICEGAYTVPFKATLIMRSSLHTCTLKHSAGTFQRIQNLESTVQDFSLRSGKASDLQAGGGAHLNAIVHSKCQPPQLSRRCLCYKYPKAILIKIYTSIQKLDIFFH